MPTTTGYREKFRKALHNNNLPVMRQIVANYKLDATSALTICASEFGASYFGKRSFRDFRFKEFVWKLLADGASIIESTKLKISIKPTYLNTIADYICWAAANNIDTFLAKLKPAFAENQHNQRLLEQSLVQAIDEGINLQHIVIKLHAAGYLSNTFIENLTLRPYSRHADHFIEYCYTHSVSPKTVSDNVQRLLALLPPYSRHTAITHPQVAQKHLAPLRCHVALMIGAGGGSIDTWSETTKQLFATFPPVNKKADQAIPASTTPIPQDFLQQDHPDWKFIRLQGRTIILENADKTRLAIKVQKQSESAIELSKEFEMTTQCLANKNHLKSYIPTPVSITPMVGIFAWLQDKISADDLTMFAKLVANENNHITYVYQIAADQHDYLTYLHDPTLSNDIFAKANRTGMTDLCRLFSIGIVYPSLTDLYHTSFERDQRDDLGRYTVLANLLSYEVLVHPDLQGQHGTGRVDKWKLAIAYPNIRGSGLADWGDWDYLHHWRIPNDQVAKHFGTAIDTYKNKVGNYLTAEILAEYQYVFFLAAGWRAAQCETLAKTQHKTAADIQSIWLTIANQIIANCALMVSHLTAIAEHTAYYTLHAIVDVNRLARQMQFWMTDEYIPYVTHRYLPKDIYESTCRTYFDFKTKPKQYFDSQRGFTCDGINQDLGDCQEPIKEFNKLVYWMLTILAIIYQQHRETAAEVRTIAKAKTVAEQDSLCATSFKHLPPQEYHGMLFAITKKRLRDPNLSQEKQTELAKKAKTHHAEYSASVIQRFWQERKYGKEHNIDNFFQNNYCRKGG